MSFEEQIKDAELVIDTRPRTYIRWNNTEPGRDKDDCYERIDLGSTIIYVNNNNRNSTILSTHPFWSVLENIYQNILSKQK